jgi:gamma-glutamyltranspeptidase/glutathione hydrolase
MKSVEDTFLGSGSANGEPARVEGFIGGVVADEPSAALVGRQVLATGGTAADAAVAVGFALAVTLPSRAGLGGGGACLSYAADDGSINGGTPEAILFVPGAGTSPAADADRPAAVPMLARGLFLLHARYGQTPFEKLILPAEQLARQGVPASRALVRDLSLVSGPLFADAGARAAFSRDGTPLAEGGMMVLPALGATLAQLRVSGVGDLYLGQLARKLAAASPDIGGPISLADLRAGLPSSAAVILMDAGRDKVAFLPPPADGGLAATAAFKVLQHDPAALDAANASAIAVASAWRAKGGEFIQYLHTDLPAGALPVLPASTSFVTVDRKGNAVACAFSMNNLFGTGRVVPGMGFLLAASPNRVAPPLLAAAIAWNPSKHAFRAAVGGSGQQGAPLAVASAMTDALKSEKPTIAPPPEPGRANVISCGGYLPGDDKSCTLTTDPRGAGLGIGSN